MEKRFTKSFVSQVCEYLETSDREKYRLRRAVEKIKTFDHIKLCQTCMYPHDAWGYRHYIPCDQRCCDNIIHCYYCDVPKERVACPQHPDIYICSLEKCNSCGISGCYTKCKMGHCSRCKNRLCNKCVIHTEYPFIATCPDCMKE